MNRLGFVAIATLVGCANGPAIQDGEFDDFLTDETKADAFGVEDWSPDGAAVLKLVSTASAAKLEDDVGLSAKVADAIVAQRKTLSGKKYSDLRELDQAKFVGITVFRRLLKYAADEKLFKTAIRVPLVVTGGNDNVSITTFNADARAAGLTAFARYTFVDVDTDYSAKAAAYDKRLEELAAKTGKETGEMLMFASTINEYSAGSIVPCYLGDPLEVADIPGSLTDSLMGDMYIQWGWRYKSKKVIPDDTIPEDEIDFGSDWDNYDKKSTDVLIVSTNTDSGDSPEPDLISACRR